MSRDMQISMTMNQDGFFNGLDKLTRTNTITAAEASQLKRYSFQRLAQKLAEAKREIGRIQGVIQRLEDICREGSVQKPFMADAPDVVRLRQEIKAMHGWIVSLAETDFYFLAVAESPSAARQKFGSIEAALSTIQSFREVMFRDPEGKASLFEL